MKWNQVHQTLLFKLLCVGDKNSNLACKTTSYHYLWNGHITIYTHVVLYQNIVSMRGRMELQNPSGMKLHGETWDSVCADIVNSSIVLGQELIGRVSNILGMCLHFLIIYPELESQFIVIVTDWEPWLCWWTTPWHCYWCSALALFPKNGQFWDDSL